MAFATLQVSVLQSQHFQALSHSHWSFHWHMDLLANHPVGLPAVGDSQHIVPGVLLWPAVHFHSVTFTGNVQCQHAGVWCLLY